MKERGGKIELSNQQRMLYRVIADFEIPPHIGEIAEGLGIYASEIDRMEDMEDNLRLLQKRDLVRHCIPDSETMASLMAERVPERLRTRYYLARDEEKLLGRHFLRWADDYENMRNLRDLLSGLDDFNLSTSGGLNLSSDQ